jgi:hypothetical protein
MEAYTETIANKDGELVLTLKREILDTSGGYLKFLKFANSLIEKLHLKHYIEQTDKTEPVHIPGISQDLVKVVAIEYVVDTVALHSDRVKAFFHVDTTKDDVAQSLSFLLKNGWSEKDFQSKIGINRTTLFHYLPKTAIT